MCQRVWAGGEQTENWVLQWQRASWGNLGSLPAVLVFTFLSSSSPPLGVGGEESSQQTPASMQFLEVCFSAFTLCPIVHPCWGEEALEIIWFGESELGVLRSIWQQTHTSGTQFPQGFQTLNSSLPPCGGQERLWKSCDLEGLGSELETHHTYLGGWILCQPQA
jgi:hypothetical protein